MNNSAFEYVRESVTAEQAATYYGVEINRQHRAKCPFHGGVHYNLSFRKGGFRCFVCGVTGDCIRFVQLYNGYNKPFAALSRLNQDFRLGLDLGENKAAVRINAEHLKSIRRKAAVRDLPECVRHILWEYTLSLEWVKRNLAPPIQEGHESVQSDLWAYSLLWHEHAEYLLDMYECMNESEKLDFIDENKERLLQYERFNGIIDGYIRTGIQQSRL